MISLGRMLKYFRKEKELSIKQICRGLCTVSLVTQFEKEEIAPDVFLFERFMERMGVSAEDFALMLTEEQYDYYLWKDEIYVAIEKKNWKRVNLLLQKQEQMLEICNRKIALQFIYYVKGILKVVEENYKEAAEYFKSAMIQTNPDMFEILDTDCLLSASEVHLLMLYLYYGIEKADRENGKQVFYKLEHYIYGNRLEVIEQAKVYPKLICILKGRRDCGSKMLKTVLALSGRR